MASERPRRRRAGYAADVLDAQHPEWRPLLAVIEEALREANDPRWVRQVPTLRAATFVVSPGDGGAEERHDPVAKALVDRAFVAVDFREHQVKGAARRSA